MHIRRAPPGARGLKCFAAGFSGSAGASCPTWGTWIEIIFKTFAVFRSFGRAPPGARGLKFLSIVNAYNKAIVVPHLGHVD